MLIPETGKKRIFIKIAAFIMAQVFFVTSLGYAGPDSNNNLRTPMGKANDRVKAVLSASNAPESKNPPAGSPFQVFRILSQAKGPMTNSMIAAELRIAVSTIDRDLGSLVRRNLVKRNGLAKAANTTYEVMPLAKTQAEEIMQLLASMGYRPTSEQWKMVQPEIEQILARAPVLKLLDEAKDVASLPSALPEKIMRDGLKIDAKTNWSDPEALTLRHFQYGILKREDYSETYNYLEGLLRELWAVADAPDIAPPGLILLEEEISDRFSEDGHIYISLGLIKDIRKQRIDDAHPEGMVYREDLALFNFSDQWTQRVCF